MQFIRQVAALGTAYTAAQILTGIEMGVVLAAVSLAFDVPLTTSALLMPAGLVLVIGQTLLFYRLFRVFKGASTPRGQQPLAMTAD